MQLFKTLGAHCSLSKPVQRRVKALKRLQLEVFDVEMKFYEELHVLEHKYENLCSSLYNKVSYICPGWRSIVDWSVCVSVSL